MKIKETDVAIIGAGSAGLSAAYQAASAFPAASFSSKSTNFLDLELTKREPEAM